jgi:hypothetical protein
VICFARILAGQLSQASNLLLHRVYVGVAPDGVEAYAIFISRAPFHMLPVVCLLPADFAYLDNGIP